MREGQRVGVIVGGQTEELAFGQRQWFAKGYIRLARCFNGDASASMMAGEIARLAPTMRDQCRLVIAMIDREQRPASGVDFARAVRDGLREHDLGVEVVVVCPDRMVENWMLADVEAWRDKKFIREEARQRNYEGTHGVDELKRLFHKKYRYRKTKHGVELLNPIREETARRNSDSFTRFMDAVSSSGSPPAPSASS